MAKFLSEEWATQAIAALRDSDDVRTATKGVDLTVQQIVTGTDGGESKYWLAIADGSVDGGIGDAGSADITITQDYETACEITRNDVNPQAAFMQGRLKVAGNMSKLLQHQVVLQVVFPVLATLPTEY